MKNRSALFLFLLSLSLFNLIFAQVPSVVVNEFLAANQTVNTDPDYNSYSDWIELYNTTANPIDISGYFITDNLSIPAKWQFPPSTVINGNSYLLVWADNEDTGMHTNFGLSRSGEEIGLFNTDTVGIDSIRFGVQEDDISYGRVFENLSQWSFYNPPSPGTANNAGSEVGVTPNPLFSIEGGLYSGSQTLSILNGDILDVYYTTDGTIPDETSQAYSGPIAITTTTPIRAIAYDTDKPPSEIITQTYFIDEPANLKIISLVTDPDNFFDDSTGIYITGTNGTGGYCDDAIRNLKQDWERPVNIEFYEKDGDQGLNQMAGIKIFGGCSRHRFPQKSLALYARTDYGKGTFQYKMFDEKEIDTFESFLLRSSADDQVSTMLRDGTAQQLLVENMDADYQAYQPVIVYLNGAYWGIHNLREKINEHYIAENYNIDPDDVNILESNGVVNHGSNAGYDALVDFVSTNDMNNAVNYSYVESQMDISQYINYMCGHIYLAERDWPGNNIRYWKANSGDYTRWRWINFDLDQSLLYNWLQEDMILKSTTDQGPGWPNPEWSTRLFRNLLENETFRNNFINRYAWHMNTTFDSTRVISIIDSMAARIRSEMPRHIVRWGGQIDPDALETWMPPTFDSMEQWEGNIDTMRVFARERQQYTIQNFINHFGLSGTSQLQINANIVDAGILRILNNRIESGFGGTFFNDIPIEITTAPLLGYQFSHWQVQSDSNYTLNDPNIDFILSDNAVLTAIFDVDTSETTNTVVINEINYKSATNFDSEDWIEIYNNSGKLIDLNGWIVTDTQPDTFMFPADYLLQPDTYLVLTRDSSSFKVNYPTVSGYMGDLNFGLSSTGEQVTIYNSKGQIVDQVTYGVISPWPVIFDETGNTLELTDHNLDNSLPQNWHTSSALYGTPGGPNSDPLAIKQAGYSFPLEYELYINYPNPFNPTTTISYSIKERSKVMLVVYDISGRIVKTLVNSYKEAGKHTVIFNAENLASGIYIYTIKSGTFSDTKKMVLIK